MRQNNEPKFDMSPRLKHIINELYHPVLQNGRQVFAISRADAELLPRLATMAVISITSPSRPIAALDGFEFLLRLQFEDVDFLNKSLSARARGKLPSAFTDHQAECIGSFVENLPESVDSIIVHCEGGFSRSCAVALCLHQLYGYRVEADRLRKANPSVIQVLMRSPKQQQVKRSVSAAKRHSTAKS